MREVASSFLASFGILYLLALAGFNPTGSLPGVKEANQHRAEVQQAQK
jgi:hypothetical protein